MRERPIACFCSPFTTGCRAVGLDVRMRVYRSSIPSKLPEQIFPNAAPGPADKTVIEGHARAGSPTNNRFSVRARCR